jgi:hypothetical protein
MNKFEKNLSSDTVMSAGLVAIGIAWVVLAAIQGPVGESEGRAAAGFANGSATLQLQADTSPRAGALPVKARRTASKEVS